MSEEEYKEWEPCHYVGSREKLSLDELFYASQVSLDENVVVGSLDLMNAALLGNAIILNMMSDDDGKR